VTSLAHIDGEWRAGTGTYELRDPADTRTIVDTVSWATPADVSDGFAAARRAAATWGSTSALVRSEILHRTADRLIARRDDIAARLTAEEGKQLADAAGEVDRSAAVLRYFAAACLLPDGATFPPEKPGAITMLRRHPVGVVSVVSPFNFPLLVPVWKIAPALAFGNTVVWKCSELVPLSAVAFVTALVEAGLPAGVMNLVTGGADIGAAMSTDPNLDAITFTGSTHVGRIVQRAVAGRAVKVQLEMGGSNPAVVLADAELGATAEHIIKGSFAAAGQRCTAIRRVIVEGSRHDELLDLIESKVSGWVMGPGAAATTQMPPMVSARQRDIAVDGVARCVAEGARLVCGGSAPSHELLRNGHFLPPTIVADLTPECFTWREEIFGPVLSFIRADSADDAVAIANDTPYGLNAGIFTTDFERGVRYGQRLKAGMVHVNAVGGFPPHLPFGGLGDSGYGPLEQGTTAVDFFTDAQILNLHPKA
jgi:alpha-ketoglutaric semialdehyde dehydrogenase